MKKLHRKASPTVMDPITPSPLVQPPEHSERTGFKKFLHSIYVHSYFKPLSVIVLVALIGTTLIFLTHAATPAPAAPTKFTANQEGSSIVLSWTAATGVNPIARYRIYRDGTLLVGISGAKTSYTDSSNLTIGQNYSYEIVAVDSTGATSVKSEAATATLIASCSSTATGPSNSVLAFGAKTDATNISNVTVSDTSKILTSSSANFTSADVGKVIIIDNASERTADKTGAGETIVGAFATTISSVTDAHTVVLTKIPELAVTSTTATYGTDDSSAFQNAVLAAANDNGYVFVPASTSPYIIGNSVNLASGVTMCGDTSTPVILSAVPASYVFKTVGITNSGYSDIDINLNHLMDGSGIEVQGSSNITIGRLTVRNVTEGWGINIGTATADAAPPVYTNSCTTSPAFSNTNISITSSNFAGFDSTFEQVLVFNSCNVTLSRNHFGSAIYQTSGAGIGLYQDDDDILVNGNTFGPNLGYAASYYSVTVNNVTYKNNTFIGTTASVGDDGIKGANESDHGLFGFTTVQNYTITGNTFTNYRTALELGAIQNATVENNTFTSNDSAITINDGNLYNPTRTSAPDSGLTIETNTFNGNGVASEASPAASPSTILIQGSGGSIGATVTGNTFNQTSGSSTNVLNFNGSSTWNGFNVTHNNFSGSSTQFVNTSNGATLGPTVEVSNN